MPDIKPYINQGDWGRDLLRKLGTLLNMEDGGLHTWQQTPSVGLDGQPLGENHLGYTGVNISNQPRVEMWNGTEWQVVFKVPIESVGEITGFAQYEDSADGMIACYIDSIFSDFAYVAKNDNDGLIRLTKVNKITGAIQWTSSASLLAPNLYAAIDPATSWGTSLYCHNGQVIFWCKQLATKTSSSAGAGNCRVFSFNESNGALLWSQDVAVAANTYLLSVTANNSNELIAFVTNISANVRILRLNASNGSILQDVTLAIALGPYNLATCYDGATNSYIVMYGRSHSIGSDVRIAKISADLNSVLSNIIIGNRDTVPQDGFGVLDPLNSSLTYYVKNPDSNTSEIYAYNNSLQTTTLLGASEEQIYGSLFGIFYEVNTNTRVFVVNNGTVFLGYKIESNQIILYEIYAPVKHGSIVVPSKKVGFSQDKEVLKTVISKVGHAGTRGTSLIFYASKPGGQVSYLQNTYLSSSPEFQEIRQEFNFSSGYIEDFKSAVSQCSALLTKPVATSTTPIEQVTTSPLQGISSEISTGGYHLFWGGLSSESQSYSAGTNRARVAGLLLGCQNVGGRVVHAYELDGAAAMVFDHVLMRLFIGCNGAQALSENIITSFPNSNGLVITSDNNVGVGMYSPAYKLDVNGEFRATVVRNSGGVISSDPQLKLNMEHLDGETSWEIITLLNAISFLYKPDFAEVVEEITQDDEGNSVVTKDTQPWPLPPGIQIGYNADEVGEILPELIDVEPRSGLKYLNSGAIAPLVHQGAVWKITQLEQANQQNQARIEALEQANQQQQTIIESLTARLEALENAA